MDLTAVVIFTAFSLINAELEQLSDGEVTQGSLDSPSHVPPPAARDNSSNSNAVGFNDSDSGSGSYPTGSGSGSNISEPILGLLTLTWTKKCEGILHFVPNPNSFRNFSSLPVCHSQHINIQSFLNVQCENYKGCKGEPRWQNTSRTQAEGYHLTERGANKTSDCRALSVKCKEVDPGVEVDPNIQSQLKAYKVMTALFICVFLILLLMRFSRPTVTALQKRLSDRRQNRWIGPTQSHSVSYHRGKSTVNNEGEKRLSYPALERLTIGGSSDF